MTFIGRLLGWLTALATLAGAVGVVLMMLQISADVFMKNVFSKPIPLTSALVANWYMVAAAFLPLALAEKLNRHIAVELLIHRLGARARRVAGMAVCLVAGVMSAGVAWHLWGEALKRMRVGTMIMEQSVGLITWPTYFFLPIGFGLMAAILFYRVALAATGARSGLGEAGFDDEGAGAEAPFDDDRPGRRDGAA